MGNQDTHARFNLPKVRQAAIELTVITTGNPPAPTMELYGARALDIVFDPALMCGDDSLGLTNMFGVRSRCHTGRGYSCTIVVVWWHRPHQTELCAVAAAAAARVSKTRAHALSRGCMPLQVKPHTRVSTMTTTNLMSMKMTEVRACETVQPWDAWVGAVSCRHPRTVDRAPERRRVYSVTCYFTSVWWSPC